MITQIKIEIKIMYSLDHPNIIRLYNHLEDKDHVYLIIEEAPGVTTQFVSMKAKSALPQGPTLR